MVNKNWITLTQSETILWLDPLAVVLDSFICILLHSDHKHPQNKIYEMKYSLDFLCEINSIVDTMGFHSRATPFNFIRGKIDHQWTSFSPFMSITSDSAQANILQRWNSFFQNGCSWTEILNSFLKNVNLRLIPQNTKQKILFNDSPPTLVHFAVLLLVCPIGPDISPSYFSHCLASPAPAPLFLLALHHRLNRNKAPLSREKERNLRMPVRTNISGIFLWLYVNTELQNAFHPDIPDGRT